MKSIVIMRKGSTTNDRKVNSFLIGNYDAPTLRFIQDHPNMYKLLLIKRWL